MNVVERALSHSFFYNLCQPLSRNYDDDPPGADHNIKTNTEPFSTSYNRIVSPNLGTLAAIPWSLRCSANFKEDFSSP